ncbi:hypothetical protein F3Y22_tig00110201pilonHSYRG00048 [Hibiscus syriacus]|uniref:Serine/threonine-protein phosphatase 2A 55 kDa regulatory subunit B n=1 Tax=Hibiscus syriacus TaxID=106335 RepID=A0A6A3BEX2_HIBSY|nr:hypothetical protein F3Y22_tig00110201pilonHSYRG00048 [Hibiscus syriacus]
MDYPMNRHPEFRYKTEFQSHEPEFDYLKSLEIEEKINKIRWCQSANGALFLLSTNDKTIKFWKVAMQQTYESNLVIYLFLYCHFKSGQYINKLQAIHENGGCIGNDLSFPTTGFPSLRLPVVTSIESYGEMSRIMHAHDSYNSISSNSYSSSKGSNRLIDMRQSALCDSHSKLFEEQVAPGTRLISFYEINSFSFKQPLLFVMPFGYDAFVGHKYGSGPVATFHVHEHLRPKVNIFFFVISMKTIPSLTNLNVVLVVMDFEWLLGRTAICSGSLVVLKVAEANNTGSQQKPHEVCSDVLGRQGETSSRPLRSLGSLSGVVRREEAASMVIRQSW